MCLSWPTVAASSATPLTAESSGSSPPSASPLSPFFLSPSWPSLSSVLLAWVERTLNRRRRVPYGYYREPAPMDRQGSARCARQEGGQTGGCLLRRRVRRAHFSRA